MSERERYIGWAVVVAALVLAPLAISSGRWIEFIELTLFIAVLDQGWNVLGGYGGQYSFGHAIFFGTGAYLQALMQFDHGWSPWAAMLVAMPGAVLVGAFIGYLSFRYGLRGPYFALITLAFAEAFRVLATSFISITEGGRGVQLALNQDPERAIALFQFTFADPFLRAYGYYYTILIILLVATAATWWMEHSRFGARLVAVRENEDAAEALGISAFRVKMAAICMSAAITAAGGIYYVQKYLFVDPSIAFGPVKSVEALFAAIIGGLGTPLGPLVGSALIHGIGEGMKAITEWVWEPRPGLDLMFFGIVLVLVLAFLPKGFVGLLTLAWRWIVGIRPRAAGKADA